MEIAIGLGEYAVSDRENDIIKTFALASCVAVTAYSHVKKVAGMIHIVLPYPMDTNAKAKQPGYFAVTGIPMLLKKMVQDYSCMAGELRIHIYGGADSIRDNDVFKVGKKNIEAVVSTLSDLGLSVHKSELGGNVSRTLIMDVKTGTVKIHRQPIMI